MLRPGFRRAVIGLVIGILVGIALITVVRLIMGLPFASGPAAVFGGFGGAVGWLWGIGSFNSHSMEHNGLEHLPEHPEPGPVGKALEAAAHATPEIVAAPRPLVPALLQGLGITGAVTVVIMVLGFVLLLLGVSKVTTDTPIATTVTPAGQIVLFDTIHVTQN